jgi:3-deoxy-manno-octulosonate cytidylyltransferase (CMP-KDO synthetase)
MTRADAVCVIPARLESTRLPKKLLQQIHGKPLLQLVHENATQAKSVSRVIVACDDESLKRTVESFGAEAILTAKHHQNGTERIAEVARDLTCEIVVNVQGDEPLMNPSTIDQVVHSLRADRDCEMSTACVAKSDAEGYHDPHVVKVTKSRPGHALYFSRLPIPHDCAEKNTNYFKHLGVYAYRRDFLLQFSKLPASKLEQLEKLEQLRAIEGGYRIKVVETVHDSIGVDTEKELELVRELLVTAKRAGVSHA